MRVLFIGGTGNISSACTRRALEQGLEVFHLNRGSRRERVPPGVATLHADIRNRDDTSRALAGLTFDVAVNWLGFTPDQVEATWPSSVGGPLSKSSSAPPRCTGSRCRTQ